MESKQIKKSTAWRCVLSFVVALGVSGSGASLMAAEADSSPEAKLFENVKLAPAYKKIGDENPVVTQRFSADPFGMEYNGRVYLYTTHDIESYENGKLGKVNYGKIKTLNVLSSDDLVNWTDHGLIHVAKGSTEPSVTKWAGNSWAPTAAHKKVNGKEKFFVYFANSAGGIGVISSDTPVGPWTDPIGKPLVSSQTPNCKGVVWMFDPAVLVDDDGKGYLYFGGGIPKDKQDLLDSYRVVALGDDMISLAGDPKTIEVPWGFEDSGINKIGDTYYYSYCTNFMGTAPNGAQNPGGGEINYMTSKNPLGPWTHKGVMFKNESVFFGVGGNNHHAMMKFKDKWYLFYHSELLRKNTPGMPDGYRCVHVDEAKVDEKGGTIGPIIGTYKGLQQVKNLDPFVENEAETIAWMGGIKTAKTAEPSKTFGNTNMVVTDIQTGDWIGLSKVGFGDGGATQFTAKVSSEAANNVIKICLDAPDGEVLGYLKVPQTGKDKFQDATAKIKKVTGVHSLFFVFAGEGFQFDSWKFAK